MKYYRSWELVGMICCGIIILFSMRLSTSISLQMISDEYGWSDEKRGLYLSSFFWGAAIGNIPSIYLAQTFGPKWTLGIGIIGPSMVNLLLPVITRQHFGWVLISRWILGIFESACYPSVYCFYRHWIPLSEKTLMIAIIMTSSQLGVIIGLSLSGIILSEGIHIGGGFIHLQGWRDTLYVYSVLGIGWFVFWSTHAFNVPSQHPHMSNDERNELREGVSQSQSHTLPPLSHSLAAKTTSREVNNGEDISLRLDYDSVDLRQPLLIDTDAADTQTQSQAMTQMQTQTYTLFPLQPDHQVSNHTVGIVITDDIAFLQNDPLQHDTQYHKLSSSSSSEVITDIQSENVENDDNDSSNGFSTIPWKVFLTHRVSLTLLLVALAQGWLNILLISELPLFLSALLSRPTASLGLHSALPYLFKVIAAVSFGSLFRRLEHNPSHWSRRCTRQVAMFVALGGTPLLLLCSTLIRSAAGAFMLVLLGFVCFGAIESGLNCAYSDVTPAYAYALNTLGHMVGLVAGSVAPLAVAHFTKDENGVMGWRRVFCLTAGILAVSLVFWACFQTSSVVPSLSRTTCQRLRSPPIVVVNKSVLK